MDTENFQSENAYLQPEQINGNYWPRNKPKSTVINNRSRIPFWHGILCKLAAVVSSTDGIPVRIKKCNRSVSNIAIPKYDIHSKHSQQGTKQYAKFKNNSLTRNSKKRGTFNTLFNHDLKNVFVHFSNDLIVNIKKNLKLLIEK